MFTAQFPRNNAELEIGVTTSPVDNHVQAIANTAGFHLRVHRAGVEPACTPRWRRKLRAWEVLRIILSLGGTEIMHFQTWHDKAGNAVPLTDGALVFPDLTADIPAAGVVASLI